MEFLSACSRTVAAYYDKTPTDPEWPVASKYDLTNDTLVRHLRPSRRCHKLRLHLPLTRALGCVMIRGRFAVDLDRGLCQKHSWSIRFQRSFHMS